jgi:hypothetical protein
MAPNLKPVPDDPEVDDPQPFDPDRLCPKCGFVDDGAYPTVMYCYGPGCAEEDDEFEHLHQTCGLCSYMWTVLPIEPQTLSELERDERQAEAEKMAKEQEELNIQLQKRKLEAPVGGTPAKAPGVKKAASPKPGSTG